jgi:hypothetical protein
MLGYAELLRFGIMHVVQAAPNQDLVCDETSGQGNWVITANMRRLTNVASRCSLEYLFFGTQATRKHFDGRSKTSEQPNVASSDHDSGVTAYGSVGPLFLPG